MLVYSGYRVTCAYWLYIKRGSRILDDLNNNTDTCLQLFDSGRVELSRSNTTFDTAEEIRAGVNTFKINVQTNAVCVDIMVWAAREETGDTWYN